MGGILMVSEIIKAQVNKLKGYVDACSDSYEGAEGQPAVSWDQLQKIQKMIEAIALGIRDPVEP
jgi:hypothetical protein